jgi:hypothetical protein
MNKTLFPKPREKQNLTEREKALTEETQGQQLAPRKSIRIAIVAVEVV